MTTSLNNDCFGSYGLQGGGGGGGNQSSSVTLTVYSVHARQGVLILS